MLSTVQQRITCAVLFVLIGLAGCAWEPSTETALQHQLDALDGPNADTIRHVYAQRDGEPLWVRSRRPTPEARALIQQLCTANEHGLTSSTYALDSIYTALRQAYVNPSGDDSLYTAGLATLDRLLTTAFVQYTNDLVNGRVHPETIDNDWHIGLPASSTVATLDRAFDQGFAATFDTLATANSGYLPLRRALTRYRTIAANGGWPSIAEGPALNRGDEGPRVDSLRARLAATGDLNSSSSDGSAYTQAVEQALRQFQRRHGLEPDGVLNDTTQTALNVPVQQRINQLLLNLERHRWLPEWNGDTHVLVHLTDFRLTAHRDGAKRLEMPIIVGEQGWQTPAFADTMSHVVFGPYWNVPASIAVEEFLPRIKQDTSFLRRNHLEVVDAQNERADTSRISKETLKDYTVRLRQTPGPHNALGQVKFMFPNDYNIYLHDTPADQLFGQDQRALSHGCIRVSEPAALTDFMLDDSAWPRDSIRTAMREATSRHAPVERTIPVYILYLTAWATDRGAVHFREDLYEHDAALQDALGSLRADTGACASIRSLFDTYALSSDSP
jgi:murein L,D-transpeptidase YcbB/YkuD